MWKLTRPENRHDKLTRDNLLDLEDHHLVSGQGATASRAAIKLPAPSPRRPPFRPGRS
nr:hypothetical protein [Streptomyces virginiae]